MNNAIRSDDPQAVEQLKAKIQREKEFCENVKAINKVVRAKPKNEITDEKKRQLLKLGVGDGTIQKLFQPDFCGRYGIANYNLTNTRQNIRRLKQRVEELERIEEMKQKPPSGIATSDYRIEENYTLHRLQVFFNEKPEYEVRRRLKANGYRWAPSEGAWQCHLHPWSLDRAKSLMSELFPVEETVEV